MTAIRLSRTPAALLILVAALTQGFAGGGKDTSAPRSRSIAVFVPGVVSGSPVYEMLVAGAKAACAEAEAKGTRVTLTVIEAGPRQADWGMKMTSLVAEGTHNLIVTSNPAMPEVIDPISAQFPSQEFLVFDAAHTGNPKVTTFRYNQREQAYISGYLAALVSESRMKHANAQTVIGLVAGQEYPAMNSIILPAYLEGARAVNPAFKADFRVVGNWYDAAKGAELARAMKLAGCDVIMPIAGGANQGVLAAARELGFYVAWFDDNGYAKAPGYVISSAAMAQERLAREKISEWISGTLQTGKGTTVGLSQGYVRFVDDDPLYLASVPESVRAKMASLVRKLESGELSLPVD